MNRQVATNIESHNIGALKLVPNNPVILNHQPAGKRRALSTISCTGHGNAVVSNKLQSHKIPFKPSTWQSQQLKGKPGVKHSTSSTQSHGFQICCDDDINKENKRPVSDHLGRCVQSKKEVIVLPSPDLESPGAQEDREEEELIVVDSPMVVDGSLENLSLKEDQDNREFLLPEYSQEIYSNLKEVEARLRPRANYMRKQTDITTGMRRILVDWLVEVCQEYKLDQETLYLAVTYIDRFLSFMAVLRAKLQLVGTACMFIAAKYEEIYPPDVSEFVYITDDTYTKQQVLRMEHLVLKVLSFDLAVPTANFFLQRLCSLCKLPARTECLARYLCELCLLEADPFLKYLPSEIACASLALANHTMGQEMWTSQLTIVSEYTEEDFRECLESVYELYLGASSSAQQAIQEKYRSHKYYGVSSITPPLSLPAFEVEEQCHL